MFNDNTQLLHLHMTTYNIMVMQKNCNLIGGALYGVLEQLCILQVTRPSPAGVGGWLCKIDFSVCM